MKETIKKLFPFIPILVRNIRIKTKLNEMYKLYKKQWAKFKMTQEKVGYSIILDEHALEKGMTSSNPRYFGVQKTKNIMDYITIYEKNGWTKDFAYNIGVSILHEYCDFYKKNDWVDREEYKEVFNFIKDRDKVIESGVIKVYKKDFTNSAQIDYNSFLTSRHSFRKFENKKITSEDMQKALDMVTKTPTACNRQMCKIYYIKNETIKNAAAKYSHGLTGFDNDSVNLIVVTYDISFLCNHGEIDQGMFNAGLISMNLVNALHSLGIGSCFLEFNDTYKEENEYKKILNIPDCEKVAVVIAAGYYPEESVIPKSTRKPLEEIYRER